MEFAKITKLDMQKWVDEIKKVEDELRELGAPCEVFTYPEFINHKWFQLWDMGIEIRDWEAMQEHLSELKLKVKKITNEREFAIILKDDHKRVVVTLAKMENAVNRSVSGMKVDIGEWLDLISKAREVLGERVID